MLLENVKLTWASVQRPDRFGKYGVVVLLEKEQAKELKKEHGLAVKRVEEEIPGIEGSEGQYFLRVSKNSEYEGVKTAPPKVFDEYGAEVTALIGNGSIGNVIFLAKPYDFNGKKGVSAKLRQIQITELVEFQESEGFEFKEAPKKKAKPVEDLDDEDF